MNLSVEQSVKVFFDESGKAKNEISLFGALLVPEDFYLTQELQSLNTALRETSFELHFTSLKKSTEKNHYETIQAFLKQEDFLKCNVVGFKRNQHTASHHHLSSLSNVNTMIYSKLPERVLYGVLRDFGNFAPIKAEIYIEDSTQYTQLELNKAVKEQLNVHSLYRQENFWVSKSGLYSKNKEIGIEFIDTILGILRTIMENKTVQFSNGEPQENYKSLWRKKHFIGRNISLLKNFLCKINYFELNGHSSLEKIDISNYLNLFLAKYYLELTYRKQSQIVAEVETANSEVAADSIEEED